MVANVFKTVHTVSNLIVNIRSVTVMKEDKAFKKEYWPIVILGGLIQLFALIDILKSHEFKRGNKLIWSALVFVLPPFGALSYYGFGKVRNN